MIPVVPILGGVAAGLGLKWLYDKYGPATGRLGEVNRYELGRIYTLRIVTAFTPDQLHNLSGPSGADIVPSASTLLKTALQQQGFNVLSDPTLRDKANVDLFRTGNKAEWIANAKWTRTDRSTATVSPPIESLRGTLQPTL